MKTLVEVRNQLIDACNPIGVGLLHCSHEMNGHIDMQHDWWTIAQLDAIDKLNKVFVSVFSAQKVIKRFVLTRDSKDQDFKFVDVQRVPEREVVDFDFNDDWDWDDDDWREEGHFVDWNADRPDRREFNQVRTTRIVPGFPEQSYTDPVDIAKIAKVRLGLNKDNSLKIVINGNSYVYSGDYEGRSVLTLENIMSASLFGGIVLVSDVNYSERFGDSTSKEKPTLSVYFKSTDNTPKNVLYSANREFIDIWQSVVFDGSPTDPFVDCLMEKLEGFSEQLENANRNKGV